MAMTTSRTGLEGRFAIEATVVDPQKPRDSEQGTADGLQARCLSRSPERQVRRKHRASVVPIVWSPEADRAKCSTLAGWPRRDASAHRQSARSPSVKRSFATSARAHAPPTSSRASSGSRRSRSPITSPTWPARSGGRLSGCAWSRPSVWTAASSSGSGPASTGPRPAPFAGISTSDPRASPSSRPEPDLRSSWPQEYQPFEHPRFRLPAALVRLLFDDEHVLLKMLPQLWRVPS